jgi:hypothetical protein
VRAWFRAHVEQVNRGLEQRDALEQHMRLYHHTNNPQRVLPGADAEYDDDELVLTRSGIHSREYDVVIRIEVPDHEMHRLAVRDKKSWTTTNAELKLAGAEVDCATDDDRERAAVYALAAQRDAKLTTIASLRRYVVEAEDRPEASRFTMMLPSHQDHLADLESDLAERSRRFGVRHLDAHAASAV